MARVLIVEDSPTTRLLLRTLIEDEGHEVAEAAHHEAALAQLGARSFDLVLVDLNLDDPGAGGGSPLQGLDLIRHIRGELHTAVVVVSGVTDGDAVKETMRLGAFDYVFKPVTPEHLLPVVQGALERDHLRATVANLRTQVE